MKNFKNNALRLVSVMMVLVLSLACFASCGSKNTNAPVKNEDGTLTIKIGGIGPTTGDYSNYGTSVKEGAQVAVNEINAAGGFNGLKFELLFEDSAADASAAVAAYGKLLDDGMLISLGGTLSGETSSIVAAAKDDGILILTPSASALDAIKGNDAAFRVCFNDPQQGTASAKYIADNKLADKVAVFYQSDLDYSDGLYQTFKAECAVQGIEIIETQTFTKGSTADFTTQVNALKAAVDNGAKVIFLPIYAQEAATLLTQATKVGITGATFFGCDGLDGILEKIADKADAEGTMLLTPFAADSDDAGVQSFVAAYKAAYGKTPDQFAAGGYDAIYTIKAALEHCGYSNETEDWSELNSKLVAAMTKIEVNGVTGKMKWTADGEAQKNANAVIIKDGVAVPFKK